MTRETQTLQLPQLHGRWTASQGRDVRSLRRNFREIRMPRLRQKVEDREALAETQMPMNYKEYDDVCPLCFAPFNWITDAPKCRGVADSPNLTPSLTAPTVIECPKCKEEFHANGEAVAS